MPQSSTLDAPAKADLIAWGGLIQYAYLMFAESQKTSPPNLIPPLPPDFPTDKWRVPIYLTARDKFDEKYPEQFYGFFAISKDNPDLIVIAIRGTATDYEWMSDFDIVPVPFSEVPDGGNVCQGFHDIWKSFSIRASESGDEMHDSDPVAALKALGSDGASGTLRAVITGHSLGAALANLYTLDVAVRLDDPADLTMVTFASPRSGDPDFARTFAARVPKATRVWNAPDLIPKLPPDLDGWKYADVGASYEIDSRYWLNIKQSYGCFHSLLTYLYVIDDNNPFGLLPQCRTLTDKDRGELALQPQMIELAKAKGEG